MSEMLLINDNSEQTNWGAIATPYALKKMLHDHIHDLSITSLKYSWLVKKYKSLKGPMSLVYEADRFPIIERVSRNVDFFPRIADEFEYVANEWMSGRGGPFADEFIPLARQADIIVHNGEHSIYRNTLEGCRALFLLWFSRVYLNKVSCEINHTAHLTSVLPIMPGMVRLVYPKLDLVTVREPESLENLKDLGIENAELVPDVVFYLDESEFDEETVARWRRSVGLDGVRYFCISASALPMDHPRAGHDGALMKLIRGIKGRGLQAVLVAKDPHCLFLEDVARETGSLFFGPDHSFNELFPLLRKADFLISGHYHYVIMASMVGCPFVPLSANSHKMKGVCKHLEWHITEPYDATFLNGCSKDIISDVEEIIRKRATFSDHLIQRSKELRQRSSMNAKLIRRMLKR